MNDTCNCCDIQTMCGYSLVQGVIFVGFATITISLVVLLSSITFISLALKRENLYYKQPVTAINVLCAMYCISVSLYQIIISILLSWQGISKKGTAFFCTLWYVSHLSILTFYSMFFIAKTIICFSLEKYFTAVLTLVLGISYDAVFIFFCVTVNSYIHTLHRDRWF